MQNKGKQKKTIELVKKPIIRGSWHGKDAEKIAVKRGLSVLATTAIYLFGCILLGFDAMWGRILTCFTLVVGIVSLVKSVGDADVEVERVEAW